MPKLITTKEVISPVSATVLRRSLELSVEAREYFIHNPEVVTGLFYAVMFYDANHDLKYIVEHDLAKDPRISSAFNALKALTLGAIAGNVSTQLVEHLLNLMPYFKNQGMNILNKFGFSNRDAATEYIRRVQEASASLSTTNPFYMEQLDPTHPYHLPSEAQGSLLLGPSAAASSSGPTSLLLGPSTPQLAASSSSGPAVPRASSAQPATVYHVTGMNIAPAGPLPVTQQRPIRPPGPPLGPKPPSLFYARPKGPYIEQIRRGDFNAEGSGLIKTSKHVLCLPYFDNYNDPYVFRLSLIHI